MDSRVVIIVFLYLCCCSPPLVPRKTNQGLGTLKLVICFCSTYSTTGFSESCSHANCKMYYFERAARIYITALQTGKELIFSSDEIAEKTAQQSENYYSDCHFNAVLDVLNEEEPEYLN